MEVSKSLPRNFLLPCTSPNNKKKPLKGAFRLSFLVSNLEAGEPCFIRVTPIVKYS